MSRAELLRRIEWRLAAGALLGNLLGVLVVFLYFAVVFPPDDEGRPDDVGLGTYAAVLVAYVALAMAAGLWHSLHTTRELRAWARGEDPPTERERQQVLGLPARFTVVTGGLWALSIPVFAGLGLPDDDLPLEELAVTVALGGLATCAATYLVVERVLRPGVAVVLSERPPAEAGSLGVRPRILLTWALCSALPLAGLVLVPVGRVPDDPHDLVWPIGFVVVTAVVFGFVAMTLAARAVADPVQDVRRAMDEVATGRTDVKVTVDDGSEVGRLQAGFNAMVEGLREREQLRDLFGRQVGEDVAREALERGVRLGGEQREVSALFVDVIGSTRLTARAAARELRERIDALDSGLDAAIGVSCGSAVAGNIGAESRFESGGRRPLHPVASRPGHPPVTRTHP